MVKYPLEVPYEPLAEIETYFKIPEPDPVSTGVGKWFCLRIKCEATFLQCVEE